jgi:hypothetical protein
MVDMSVLFTAVNCWLEIKNTVIPVASAQLDFELNAIPQAIVTIPLGREGYTGELSPAHGSVISLAEPTDAKLVAKLSPRFGVDKNLNLPNEKFVLFEGEILGFGLEKNMDPPAVNLVLMLRHWLSLLDYSSIFSRWGHPANPAQYNAAAVPPIDGAGVAGYLGPYDAEGHLSQANIEKDIWDSALKPFLLSLTKKDGLRIPEQADAGGDATGDNNALPNTVAEAALKRIKSYPSLALNLSTQEPLGEAIQEDLGNMLGRDINMRAQAQTLLSGSTFWSLIVGIMAAEYMFAVVPRINDAKVIPFMPALRTVFKKIPADEVFGCRASGELPRPIRAFGILSTIQTHTYRPIANVAPFLVGGWFAVKDRKQGIIRIENAPRWAVNLRGAPRYTKNSAGAFGKGKATADQPDAVGPPDPKVIEEQQAQAKASQIFLSRYARARLVHEHGAARQGTFTGPFRLDIAPGTSLAWEGTTDLFTNAKTDRMATTFYGTVLRVSLMLSAEPPQAWTTFHLSHVRTSEQNKSDGYSISAHPLYKSPFVGTSLYAK